MTTLRLMSFLQTSLAVVILTLSAGRPLQAAADLSDLLVRMEGVAIQDVLDGADVNLTVGPYAAQQVNKEAGALQVAAGKFHLVHESTPSASSIVLAVPLPFLYPFSGLQNVYGWYRLSGNNVIDGSGTDSHTIETHIRPVIAGPWNIDFTEVNLAWSGARPDPAGEDVYTWKLHGVAALPARAEMVVFYPDPYNPLASRLIVDEQELPTGPNWVPFNPNDIPNVVYIPSNTINIGTIPYRPSITRLRITIWNVGGQPLSISNIGAYNLGAILKLSSAATLPVIIPAVPGSLIPAYQETTFDILIDPQQLGAIATRVDLFHSDSTVDDGYVYSFDIVGTCANAPEIQVFTGPNEIQDDDTLLAPTIVNLVPTKGYVYTYTIRNQGTATMNLTGLTITSPGATAIGTVMAGGWDGATTTPVLPGGSVDLLVRVSPTLPDPPDSGAFQLDLAIASNDADEDPFDIHIVGNARARVPQVQISRTSTIKVNGLDVVLNAPVAIGTPLTYTVTNIGDKPLIGGSVTLVTDSNVTTAGVPTALPSPMAPGATATFIVTVTPASTLTWYSQFLVTSNANDFGYTASSYSVEDDGKDKECGFGQPFGLLLLLSFALLIGGVGVARRR